ncbi:MAG: Rieske (2Fe-2S) protein [Actinomycetota bacterium]
MDDGFLRIASLAEVPEGAVRAFELPWGRLAVARVDEEVFALADSCTHASCSLSEGDLTAGEDAVVCPCHGSTFDLRSGEPLEGPALDPVAVHAARVRDGWIEIGPSTEVPA